MELKKGKRNSSARLIKYDDEKNWFLKTAALFNTHIGNELKHAISQQSLFKIGVDFLSSLLRRS